MILATLSVLAYLATPSQPISAIVGNVRIEFLAPDLVRIEERKKGGFTDASTFTVVGSEWQLLPFNESTEGASTVVRCRDIAVTVPHGGSSVGGTTVSLNGQIVFTAPLTGVPEPAFFPAPASKDKAYVLADTPRIVPPEWGATPPEKSFDGPTSGWDLDNDAPDIYVFLNRPGGYQQMRRDFLKLTGPTPLPPLFIFGFTDSRYHPYTEQEALDSIDTYRSKQIPLDMFVVDTDWRVNGSHGYTPEPKYFPDMPRFLQEAHQRDVRIMFNDHPEPQTADALDPKELQYRWDGLTKLMDEGVDVWWYDRNWGVSLKSPVPSLRHEVWGQYVYHDVTERYRPNQRPLIMTNVDGIDGGALDFPPHPASHRFPIWWTGDTPAIWRSLQRAVSNAVDEGVIGFLPYVNDDLGGHYGTPDSELYARYLEYGCLCPITRVHCTRGEDRHPWAFGAEDERIVTDYIKLRYRLLPTIYSAAHRNYGDGTPLLRRLDLFWPSYAEASRSDEYLLGDDLLVAPITTSAAGKDRPIPPSLLHTPDGAQGLKGEYFANQNLEGSPAVVRGDRTLSFDWGGDAPMPGIPQEHFSVRWTGAVGPLPETGDYELVSTSDDGIRVFLDGKAVIDQWHDSNSERHVAHLRLEKGTSHALKVEFYQNQGQSRCILSLNLPRRQQHNYVERQVWIPPGEWQDAWTGKRIVGPRTLKTQSPLWHTPMWIREGGIVSLAAPMQHTTDAYWRDLTIEAYVPKAGGTTERTLYEDDGISTRYLKGGGTQIPMTLTSSYGELVFHLGADRYPGRRRLTLRLHLDRLREPSTEVWGMTGVTFNPLPLYRSGQMPLLGKGASAGKGEPVMEISGFVDPGRDVEVRIPGNRGYGPMPPRR